MAITEKYSGLSRLLRYAARHHGGKLRIRKVKQLARLEILPRAQHLITFLSLSRI